MNSARDHAPTAGSSLPAANREARPFLVGVWCDECGETAQPDDFNPIAERTICARCISELLETDRYVRSHH